MIGIRFLLRSLLPGVLLFWQTWGVAAPEINWGELLAQAQSHEKQEIVEIDLRQRWEATHVGGVKQPGEIAIDPEQVWAWSGQRFS